MTLFDLSGRRALVTGSSRGIGRAIAEALAAHGAGVVTSGRRIAPAQEAADAIAAAHGAGRAQAVAADIGDPASLDALADEAEAFGPIDVLVLNAASNPHFGAMATLDDATFARVLDANVIAGHRLAQRIGAGMAARGRGSIVFVASIAGLAGSARLGAYAVSKAAVLQLMRNLAVELGPSGVRVNAIVPGLIRTDFSRALWGDPATAAAAERASALRRIGEPGEIAGAAVFLASDAASFVTGQGIVVDGGVTIGGVL